MLDLLCQRVRSYCPEPSAGRRPQAAVLVPVLAHGEPELLLTVRAHGLSTHGGEVAFPGGRRDPDPGWPGPMAFLPRTRLCPARRNKAVGSRLVRLDDYGTKG